MYISWGKSAFNKTMMDMFWRYQADGHISRFFLPEVLGKVRISHPKVSCENSVRNWLEEHVNPFVKKHHMVVSIVMGLPLFIIIFNVGLPLKKQEKLSFWGTHGYPMTMETPIC